ncbi:MAG: excinuclease ABC subunit UvrA [Candidatus Komeilibacteria bacterium CG_4_10_14_0_2_um_filter_37_10]|uniref:UvrABC system protein A n=1 Tax=Candidatus Komeilibacteria bacterium CG_4_10_14_0_2_um_filter_37_10 TaxID=1974470 RepID=A0A2M7VD45_9BACT|nr:MAG: excinuclease ABC subunit UvrA [Candidatus Komeilibacteria bacterium CG_4_10_14_0_2_um_filter_37_10]
MSKKEKIAETRTNKIVIKGARVHNLQNIDVDIPRDQLVVITGLSGSGKSSLAFDTIYAEGQRRYVESLSAYARQFLGLMDKPDVDQIDGLSPAISIDQRTAAHNPRSTVGTVTEIYDYLRLLYARIGKPHCPNCGQLVCQQTIPQITERIFSFATGTPIMLLAPVIRDKKGEYRSIIMQVEKAGYAKMRIDGLLYSIEEAARLNLDKQKKHDLEIVVDRLEVKPDNKARLVDSLEKAIDLGDGLLTVHNSSAEKDYVFSQHLACAKCDINLPPLEPRNFSFNSPHGACPDCTGLGTKLEVDAELIIPNKKLTLAQGAIRPWSRTAANQTWYYKIIEAVAKAYKFSVNVPVDKLSKKQMEVILHGTGDKKVKMNYTSEIFDGGWTSTFDGVIPHLERRYRETDSDYIRSEIERYMRIYPCPTCQGRRLKPESLAVTLGDQNIINVTQMTVDKLDAFFASLTEGGKKALLTEREMKIAHQILKEIRNRLKFLNNVGLSYLTLDRRAATLSGGEAQRIRLATQIGSSLVGVIYILDEPSIGLHPRDNQKLIDTLKELRNLGNSVIVVEHDEETMLAADYLIDIGPGAGALGGKIVAAGTPAEIMKNKNSLTGQYLSGVKFIELPKKVRNGNGKEIKIIGATEFNLKNIDVAIPLGKLVCITGVSGSGKSTLMQEILAKALANHFHHAKDFPGQHKRIEGLENLDKVIAIDQSPIGRTPRSNPATYTGVFTYIRDLFTQLPEAKIRGYKAGRFSFNVKGGRCESCQGDGLVKIEMNFLPDVYVECEECHGKRFAPQTLEIHYRNKNISDVLAMSVGEAMVFFSNIPSIYQKLTTLNDVGLGYIKLGQSATTLSGGEAQRIKLATELSRRATGKTLYILDEPTTGLHFDDVKRLLQVLNRLVDKGNSVLVIEHNLDVIKSADWLVDLGPEGGDLGGYLVAEGKPQDLAKIKESYTGQYLKKLFSK